MADYPMPLLGFEIESIITQLGIFAFLVNTLNGQIQVRYKSMKASPLDTHKGVMLAFLIALFIYATASVAEIMLRARESIYHPFVSYIRLFASGFATILLLVILDPVLGYIISVLWGCLFARATYESCKELRSHTAQLGHSLWTKLVGVLAYQRTNQIKLFMRNEEQGREISSSFLLDLQRSRRLTLIQRVLFGKSKCSSPFTLIQVFKKTVSACLVNEKMKQRANSV